MPTCPQCGHPLVEIRATVLTQGDVAVRGEAVHISGAGGTAYSSPKAPTPQQIRGARTPAEGGKAAPTQAGRPALRVDGVPGYRCNYCHKVYFAEEVDGLVDRFGELLPERGVDRVPFEAAVRRLQS